MARTRAPPTMIFALSPGERGDRMAVGEGSFPNIPHPSRILLPELSNLYCHPGKAGESPNGLGGILRLRRQLQARTFRDNDYGNGSEASCGVI